MYLERIALTAILIAGPVSGSHAQTDRDIERLVARHIEPMLSASGMGGAAVAVRIEGRTLFFNHGWADRAAERRITADSLFNLASLRKVFDATLLARSVLAGEVKLEDPASQYVVELQQGGDIRHVTLGQLATHTSGLLLPQDHSPWPHWGYTLPQFIRTLNAWRMDFDPGKPNLYTHAGFVVLQLALERRLEAPIDQLMQQRLLQPLGMTSTALPRRDASVNGQLSPAQKRRVVQGYDENGAPIGEPGDQQGYYHWPGTSQMYSSTRDMAVFLAANLGELPIEQSLQEALNLTQRSVLRIGPRNFQALAWEIVTGDGPTIVEKYGGLNNASAYIGMMPDWKLGIVILTNRGNHYPNEVGRRILLEFAAPRAGLGPSRPLGRQDPR